VRAAADADADAGLLKYCNRRKINLVAADFDAKVRHSCQGP